MTPPTDRHRDPPQIGHPSSATPLAQAGTNQFRDLEGRGPRAPSATPPPSPVEYRTSHSKRGAAFDARRAPPASAAAARPVARARPMARPVRPPAVAPPTVGRAPSLPSRSDQSFSTSAHVPVASQAASTSGIVSEANLTTPTDSKAVTTPSTTGKPLGSRRASSAGCGRRCPRPRRPW